MVIIEKIHGVSAITNTGETDSGHSIDKYQPRVQRGWNESIIFVKYCRGPLPNASIAPLATVRLSARSCPNIKRQ